MREIVTAVHEAGHAVVAHQLGVALGAVDIDGTADRRGIAHVELRSEDFDSMTFDDADDLVGRLGAVSWAGLVAQERAGHPDDGGFGRIPGGGAAEGSDWGSLLELAFREAPEDGILDPVLDRWRLLAERILQDRWAAVETLATALLAAGRLEADEVLSVLDASAGGSDGG